MIPKCFGLLKGLLRETERERMIGAKSLVKPTQIRNANNGSLVNDDAHKTLLSIVAFE